MTIESVLNRILDRQSLPSFCVYVCTWWYKYNQQRGQIQYKVASQLWSLVQHQKFLERFSILWFISSKNILFNKINTIGLSMSFSSDFISIISWFYPDKIKINWAWCNLDKVRFVVLSKNLGKIRIKLNLKKITLSKSNSDFISDF